MYMFCNPNYDNYGFHQFFNKPKREWHVYLLVENGLNYYTVGNLNIEAKNPLPEDISEQFPGEHDASNMDRVIVGVDQNNYVCTVCAYI